MNRRRISPWCIAALIVLVGTLFGVRALVLDLFAPSEDEVARVTSPDGRLDAVVVEINGGATTSFAYAVYVTEKAARFGGEPIAFLYDATRSERAYGVNLKWRGAKKLVVEYLRTGRFRVEKGPIEVVLKGGVTDPSAPGGGMFYNLRGK